MLGARSVRPAPPAPVPRVHEARCTRRREGDVGCRACVLACPTEAIWTDARGRLRIQEIDCVGCGACVSACPTGAIEVRGIAPEVALRPGRGDAATTVGCGLGPEGDAGGAPVDARVPCLAALHPEALAARLLAAPESPVRLDASGCGRCTLGRLYPQIEAHVAQAVAFARLFGTDPDLRIVAQPVGGAPAAANGDRRLTRRELFGVARDRAAERLVDAVARAVAENPTGPGGRTPPPHRVELLAAARGRVGADATPPTVPVLGAFYVDWTVSDACDGCASANVDGPRCAARCPTGAWNVAHEAGTAALTFDVAACTACGACERACPRGALTPVPAPGTAGTGRAAKRALPLVRCRGCHRAIPLSADGRCGNCRKRVGATPVRTRRA